MAINITGVHLPYFTGVVTGVFELSLDVVSVHTSPVAKILGLGGYIIGLAVFEMEQYLSFKELDGEGGVDTNCQWCVCVTTRFCLEVCFGCDIDI